MMSQSLKAFEERKTLYPFQKTGGLWLSRRKVALLADEMGLGKSATAIYGADLANVKSVCIVCPAVARINWVREIDRFSVVDRNFSIIVKKNQKILTDSVISSYDLCDEIPTDRIFDLLILDESHYLKSLNSKRTVSILGTKGLVRRAKRIWALSGTPCPNNISELWPILYTFRITPLSFNQFVEEYCTTYFSQQNRYVPVRITGTKKEKVSELKNMLEKIMLRRKKDDCLDLPEIFFHNVTVEPDTDKKDLDYRMGISPGFAEYFLENKREELFSKIENDARLMKEVVSRNLKTDDKVAAIQGIQKSISSLRMYTGLLKVKAITEMVKEEFKNKNYEKLVIFAVHHIVIENLRENLKDLDVVTLYGSTPPEKRQRNIDRFINKKCCKVFIGNIQAAGTAITLTNASNIIFAESSFVPGDNAQAAMRCHRIGQKEKVHVRFISLANSYDEEVNKILQRKTRDLTQIFDS